MKLFYLTAKMYPGRTADHSYILLLAQAFATKLKDDFFLIVCNTKKESIPDLPLIHVKIPPYLKRTLFFFFWLPWFCVSSVRKQQLTKERIIFFCNDLNLLSLLIFWKKILNLKLDIVTDWHLLSHSWKDRWVAKNTNCSITTSQKLKKLVLEISPLSNTQCIYGGVNLKPYLEKIDKKTLRNKLGLPEQSFLIGYVGLFKTLNKEKGLSMMVKAAQTIDNNSKMIFVGGKEEEIRYYSKMD